VGASDPAAAEKRIVDTSLKYRVLSRFTAFVAVDQRVVNEGGRVHRVTQPVDLPSGWEPPMAAGFAGAPAPSPQAQGMARMQTFAASPASFADSLARRFLPGGAPGGGRRMPPRQPPLAKPAPPPNFTPEAESLDAMAAPPSVEQHRSDALIPPVAPPPAALVDFVAQELRTLTAATKANVWTRAGLLTALAERIRVHLGPWEVAGEPQSLRLTLGKLSAELAVPTADPAEVDRRWQHTLTTLASLTSPTANPTRQRRTFWKR
jgi:Ca-activated chloride channel family protein